MLNLTFLGTSAGVPTKNRNVTGLAIECLNPFATHGGQISPKKRPWVLVDCGEATQHQLLKTNISSQQLRVICITHVHGDHCYGLPGLLASMAMSGRKDTLTIIAPKTIKQFLEVIQQTTQLYLPFNIEFIAIEHLFIANTDVQDKVISDSVIIQLSASHRLVIEVVRLSHRVASYAFKFTQTLQTIKLDIDKLKAEGIKPSSAWGRLQAGEDVVLEDGRQLKSVDYTKRNSQSLKVVVAGDNDTPALLSEAVANTDLLVHESTYTQAVADKIMSRPNT
ncbi:MBL fold metallo-hydrolase, partial [Psychrobacter sp.]|uniref:MBL fold metallo-hydrolase n=1 Tax=Psychrobacter sp. TaxID=56811 RepID=UPI0025FD37BE